MVQKAFIWSINVLLNSIVYLMLHVETKVRTTKFKLETIVITWIIAWNQSTIVTYPYGERNRVKGLYCTPKSFYMVSIRNVFG